jgi:hypothetical protein
MPPLRLQLAEANADPGVSGLDVLPGRSHYFVGKDPGRWVADVPQYGQVRYQEVYPGIDLVFHGREGRLEYDFVVAPGADSRRIRMTFDGAHDLRLDAQGDLVLQVGGGELVQKAPEVYQEIDGARRRVPGRYVRKGRREVAFAVGPYDRERPLVIDPVLLYSTYLGTAGVDAVRGVGVDSSGDIYLLGGTDSLSFPTVDPIQGSNGGGNDLFVAKLDPTGTTLLYSTYLGGSGSDVARSVAVDAAGNAYLVGTTYSSDFPTVGPVQGYGGGTCGTPPDTYACGDAMVARWTRPARRSSTRPTSEGAETTSASTSPSTAAGAPTSWAGPARPACPSGPPSSRTGAGPRMRSSSGWARRARRSTTIRSWEGAATTTPSV